MSESPPIPEEKPQIPRPTEQEFAALYQELRRLASQKMARESGVQTLQPTALVHEAWIRLGGDQQPTWQNRNHFFCAAAEAMRRILIDRARRKQTAKHGGGWERVELEATQDVPASSSDQELLQVDEVLDAFAQHAPQKAELVKLRYFAGMNLKEAGASLGISEPTAVRWWTYSKTWLYQAIQDQRNHRKTGS